MNREWIFGIATGAVVLIGVILAFMVTGSPGHQRALALDERRLDDIERIASAMVPRYYKTSLPRTLPSDIAEHDPETKQPYEYLRLSDKNYQLCAHLDVASPTRNAEDDIAGYSYRHWRNHHGAGRVCFIFRKNTDYPEEPEQKTPR